MVSENFLSLNDGVPPAGEPCNFVSLEKDVLPHLATAARTLAIKGFSPEEATSRGGTCLLAVRGRNAHIEGKIEFKCALSGEGGIGWDYAISSPGCPEKSENGTVAGEGEIKHVVEAFVSVFTTVASFTDS
jgi:hypothetical protein